MLWWLSSLGRKDLTPDFIVRWRGWLERIVNDPETLWSPDAPES